MIDESTRRPAARPFAKGRPIFEKESAFTGQVPVAMLKDIGVVNVILGPPSGSWSSYSNPP